MATILILLLETVKRILGCDYFSYILILLRGISAQQTAYTGLEDTNCLCVYHSRIELSSLLVSKVSITRTSLLES